MDSSVPQSSGAGERAGTRLCATTAHTGFKSNISSCLRSPAPLPF